MGFGVVMPPAPPVSGGLARVAVDGPVTDFKRVQVSEPRPVCQVDASYGLPSGAFVTTNSAGTGAVGGFKGYFTVGTGGTGAGAYATAFTTRPLRFRAGQGCEAYVVCKLDTPQAGTIQLVGAFTAEDGYAAGYGYEADGTTFSTDPCVHIKSGGVRQVETLTLSGASGAGTVDITLSGVTTNVALSATTLSENAWEISEADFPGWRAYSIQETVVFIAESVGVLAGGAFASNSGNPCNGAFATTTTGDAGTDTWITQPNWNADKLDGTGPSGLTVDPSAYNTLRITYSDTSAEFAWLAGDRFVVFHRWLATDSVTITNSSLPIQATCYNAAAVAASKQIGIAGMSGFISGPKERIAARRGSQASVLGLGTTLRPICSYRLAPTFRGPSTAGQWVFTGEVAFPSVSVVNDGGRGVIVELVINADLDAPVWTPIAGLSTGSAVDEDTTATTFGTPGTAGGVTIKTIAVAKGQSVPVDLAALDLVLLKNQTITFAARSLANTTDIIIAPDWQEVR